jgi:hypothetical protein
MGLDHLNGVLEADWAVTLYLKLLAVSLANNTTNTHIDKAWKKLWLF